MILDVINDSLGILQDSINSFTSGNAFLNIFSSFISFIYEVIGRVIAFIMIPINFVITSIIPDLSSYINLARGFVNNYLLQPFIWFFNIFPPNFKILCLTLIEFLVAFFGVFFTIYVIEWAFRIYHKIKFW